MKDDDLPDSTPSAEEQARADERRRAVEGGAEPLASLLAAAARPRDLAQEAHDRILASVLGEDVALGEEPPADAPEREAAEGLRRALEGSSWAREEHPLARVAETIRAAHAPRELPEIRSEAILRRELRGSGRARPTAVYAAVAGALALAAGVMGLWLSSPGRGGDLPSAQTGPLPGMVEVRSTAPLFSVEDFPQGGGKTSERADRITAARASDLRQNRYRAWGLE
jgi:hypothetical protein